MIAFDLVVDRLRRILVEADRRGVRVIELKVSYPEFVTLIARVDARIVPPGSIATFERVKIRPVEKFYPGYFMEARR